MITRKYRVVVAKTKGGLYAAARKGWTVLETTIREFASLDTNDDQSLGNIGAVTSDGPGFVAIAYRDAG